MNKIGQVIRWLLTMFCSLGFVLSSFYPADSGFPSLLLDTFYPFQKSPAALSPSDILMHMSATPEKNPKGAGFPYILPYLCAWGHSSSIAARWIELSELISDPASFSCSAAPNNEQVF